MNTNSEPIPYSNHPRHPSLARFADLFRDSISTKRAPSPAQPQPASTHFQVDAPSSKNGSDIARRGSSTRYADMVMHMFSSSSRNSAALNINDLPVEILQNIILNLDMVDLFRIRRVCKHWRDMVPGDSPLLAEALFIKPSSHLHAYSLTLATFDFDFDIRVRAPPEGNLKAQPTFINGLSMSRRCQGLVRASSEFIFHPIIVNFNQLVQGDENGYSKLVTTKETPITDMSWRNVLVSMPPLTELRINGWKGSKYAPVCILTAEDGVRLGEVFDALDRWGRHGRK